MKLTMKFLFGALLVSTLFFTSCTKDTENVLAPTTNIADEEVTAENFELWLDQQVAQVEGELTVEHASLAEINAEMIANGLEPFTEAEVAAAQAKAQDRLTWPCSTWVFLGDWNDSGTLTTFDLVQAIRYLCDNTGDCMGSVDTSSFPFDKPKAFGYLSYLETNDQAGLFTLNPDDVEAGRGQILGIIACY